jgi:hypothetical protein
MKAKTRLRFITTLLIICCLTPNLIYGQEVSRNDTLPNNALISNDTLPAKADSIVIPDTVKTPYFPLSFWRHRLDTAAIDTTQIPYLSAAGISFTDSLKEALKNNLSKLFESGKTAESHIPTFFTKHLKSYKELDKTKLSFDWFFAVFFSFLAILAVIRLCVPNLFSAVLYRKTQRDLLSKTEKLPKNFLFFLLIASSWMGFSLALAEVLAFWDFAFPFEPLLFSAAVVFAYFFSKYLLKKIAGWLFQMDDAVAEHLSIAVNTNFVWVLAAFLLVLLNHYAANSYIIWVICLIFGVNFLQRLVLEWIIFSKKQRKMEILLYLCTIEVLPLLLFGRYVMNYF